MSRRTIALIVVVLILVCCFAGSIASGSATVADGLAGDYLAGLRNRIFQPVAFDELALENCLFDEAAGTVAVGGFGVCTMTVPEADAFMGISLQLRRLQLAHRAGPAVDVSVVFELDDGRKAELGDTIDDESDPLKLSVPAGAVIKLGPCRAGLSGQLCVVGPPVAE